MKKKTSPKKLTLSKETLRGLEDGEQEQALLEAVGGVTGTCIKISGCPRCP
ncbi:MAG TPA: class I lanthipeptide [Thermoanaerobaculia bacterium]|nr:class I lanthipeptide [Thermoanaerobaculia bacterium]